MVGEVFGACLFATNDFGRIKRSTQTKDTYMPGPLAGIRVLEVASIGPGPFCAMMLADMGAEVIRIDRRADVGRTPWVPPRADILSRGRRSLALDLKQPEGAQVLLDMAAQADLLVEGFRPGVMERLGVGPEACLARNPKLVYGRMTGWGQSGPLAQAAGHDLNYIALSGALHGIGHPDTGPVPPLNLVGDFGGGGAMLAFGLACALIEARGSGRGQVVDAAMTEGSALLMSMFYSTHAAGRWHRLGENMLDGAAHFYGTYRCADGRWLALGSVEPQFYALLLDTLGIGNAAEWPQHERARWPELKRKLAERFATRTRDDWCALMEGTDICFAPVLDLDEAPRHPHAVARGSFVSVDGTVQPAPVPRFSRSQPATPHGAPVVGAHSEALLAAFGFDASRVEALRAAGVFAQAAS